MENNTILTNEQVDSLVEVLGESKNETDSLLAQIIKEHENDDNSNAPLEEGFGEYVGDGVILTEGDTDDEFIKFNHFENIDSSLDDIVNDNLKDSLSDRYNLTEEEVIKFSNLIMRFRAGDTSRMFNELPQSLKDMIIEAANEQQIPLVNRQQFYQFMAESLVNELISDAELNALSIDLEKAMQEMIPAPMEMYSEFNKEYIEEEFPRVAEKIKEENPKTANNLLNMREGFINAYTYENMYKLLENNKIVKNIRRCEVLWSRTNTEYLRLAELCKFKLYALADILNSLIKIGYSELQAKRLITLFVYTYTNGVEDYNDEKEYNDIYRNAFANYFEMNINNMAITPDLQSDFSKEIRENLDRLIKFIDRLIAEKDEELSNKKNKKKG